MLYLFDMQNIYFIYIFLLSSDTQLCGIHNRNTYTIGKVPEKNSKHRSQTTRQHVNIEVRRNHRLLENLFRNYIFYYKF